MSKSVEDLLRELDSEESLRGGTAVAPARPRKLARRATGDTTVVYLVAAAILIAVVGSLPGLSTALYPFALFVTLVHECSHALAATLSGGSVDSLRISPDLSGVTNIRGGVEALIAPAGYLGASAAGAAILAVPLRYSRWVVGVLALVPVAALLAFGAGSTFTIVWCVVLAAALAAAAWWLPPRLRGLLQIFLGVEAGLNAFRDLMTLVLISSTDAHLNTDADLMSQALFLPSLFWAVSWVVLSIVLLLGTLLLVLRRDVKQLRN